MSNKVFECPSCKNPAIILVKSDSQNDKKIIKCNGIYSDSKMIYEVAPCGLSITSEDTIESVIQRWNRLPRY